MATTNTCWRMDVVGENVGDGLRLRRLLNTDHSSIVIHPDQDKARCVRSDGVRQGENILGESRLPLWLLQVEPLALELHEVGLTRGDEPFHILCAQWVGEVVGARSCHL